MESFSHKYLYAETRILESLKHREIGDRLPGERVLAKEIGVSYMTVRKAVDNLVAKGVLYRIPQKGTYVADRKAIRRKTKNIGYFLDSSIKDGLTSPYYSLIFNALEKEASKKGYALLFFSEMGEFISLTNLKKIDGAVVSCFPRVENILQTMKKQVPIVGIDNSSADTSIPSVTIENFGAVAESIDYLCTLGHKRIGFITGLDDSAVGRDRLAGYYHALASHGIEKDSELVYRGDYSFETGIEAADYFLSLEDPPTAIMCANDIMAIGAIKECHLSGFKVPDEISIVGFDDISIASQMTPALTTVAAPIMEIAKFSINMLDALINHDNLDNPHIALPGKLVVRNTAAQNKDLLSEDA